MEKGAWEGPDSDPTSGLWSVNKGCRWYHRVQGLTKLCGRAEAWDVELMQATQHAGLGKAAVFMLSNAALAALIPCTFMKQF